VVAERWRNSRPAEACGQALQAQRGNGKFICAAAASTITCLITRARKTQRYSARWLSSHEAPMWDKREVHGFPYATVDHPSSLPKLIHGSRKRGNVPAKRRHQGLRLARGFQAAGSKLYPYTPTAGVKPCADAYRIAAARKRDFARLWNCPQSMRRHA